MKKNIYIAYFPMTDKGIEYDVQGFALCEDGTGLASHWCSSKYYIPHDMGITSDWKHDTYDEHCPDGYDLILVEDPENDNRWEDAMKLNRELYPEKDN